VDCHSHGDINQIKTKINCRCREQVEGISVNYNMGLITNNERYNQVIDGLANAQLTELAMKTLERPTRFQLSVYDA
jgi:DNA-directed RNA polymerase subunit beta'